MNKIILSLFAVSFALAPTTVHATSRFDVANDARAIIAQVDVCDHDVATVRLAYTQTLKGAQIVQMSTRIYPYTANPTETDIRNVAAILLPAPRTTNSRLLADGERFLEAALATLQAGDTCPPS